MREAPLRISPAGMGVAAVVSPRGQDRLVGPVRDAMRGPAELFHRPFGRMLLGGIVRPGATGQTRAQGAGDGQLAPGYGEETPP